MASHEDNFLPNLVRYAAEKVKDSETFLILQRICVEFNNETGNKYGPKILINGLVQHLKSGTLDFITIDQRLQIHYVLEVAVPVHLRPPEAKFDEKGCLLEYSGMVQLGEPNFNRIFDFLKLKSWVYDQEPPCNEDLAQRYLEWRKEQKVFGPIGEGYLVQKFADARHILQDTESLEAEDKVRIMIWIEEPLTSEELERSLTESGKIKLEGRKIVAYMPEEDPVHLKICKTHKATTKTLTVNPPPAKLNPPQRQYQHENRNFDAQRPVAPVLPPPSVHCSDHDKTGGNVSVARHIDQSDSSGLSDVPPVHGEFTRLVSRKFLLERLEFAIYEAGISAQSDKLAKVVANDISLLDEEKMLPIEDAEKELLKALEFLCRETPSNDRLDKINSMALARMGTALNSYNTHDEHHVFPSFCTMLKNARKTDGYDTRRILRDNAYNTFLHLFNVWKNPNLS